MIFRALEPFFVPLKFSPAMGCRSKLETEKGGRSVSIENNYVMNPSLICYCPAGIELIS